jgi:hypothetical protein
VATLADLIADLLSYPSTTATILPQSLREAFINEAIRRIERSHRFHVQEATVELAYPANQDFVALPSDFIAEYGVWEKTTSATPSASLAPIPKTHRRFWIEAREPTTRDTVYPQTASPAATVERRHYYLWRGTLAIVPTPSADLTLVLDYEQRVPDLVGSGTNGFTERYPDLVRAAALAEVYGYLHEMEAATAWDAIFRARLADTIREDEAIAASGPPQTRGRG